MNTVSTPSARSTALRLFFVSVAGLFLELLLIRWIGTEINIFAYLQNAILIMCFLGLGMGCAACRKPINLLRALLWLFGLILILSVPATRAFFALVSLLLGNLGNLLTWDSMSHSYSWFTLYGVMAVAGTWLVMWAMWEIFYPIGQVLGQLMDDHPNPMLAYSINVSGSLIGIWLFVALSALSSPPPLWILVFSVLIWPVLRAQKAAAATVLAGSVAALWFSAGSAEEGVLKAAHDLSAKLLEVSWSPYQKLALFKTEPRDQQFGDYLITVNGSGYQGILNLDPEHVRAQPQLAASRQFGLSQYDLPLLFHPHPQSFLVVGAGSGNDVSGGLRHHIPRITAVEIDPAIIDFGRRYHPEHPYENSAVEVVNDDARSFFSTSHERFDVISFGLLDSHTSTAMTNARLDHYVYTKESIAQAKSLLSEHGVMTLTFEAQKPFIADRMGRVLREIFKQDPLVFRIPGTAFGWGGVMFVTGDLESVRKQIANHPALQEQIEEWKAASPAELTYTTPITSDDWPYIYLERPGIPPLFGFVAISALLLFLLAARRTQLTGFMTAWGRSEWHFFFLGAAFLLLEVQNISKASVALGNTWIVNAVIISGVLIMILLANLVSFLFPRLPRSLASFLLLASTLGLYFVDWAQFASQPFASKVVVVGLLSTLPMFFSGLVFVRSFAETDRRDVALGANLIGSLFGGLLQSLTFLLGIKALLLFVAGFYGVAMLCAPKLSIPRAASPH